MITISARQVDLFQSKVLEDSVTDAMNLHPRHKAALPDPAAFHRFCCDIARAYQLDDAQHVVALVALCLDLGPRRAAFFAQPEIAALPEAEAMQGHQRLHLAAASAYQQGLLRGPGA